MRVLPDCFAEGICRGRVPANAGSWYFQLPETSYPVALRVRIVDTGYLQTREIYVFVSRSGDVSERRLFLHCGEFFAEPID